MIIYSELTGKQYKTVEDCVEAERKLKEEIQRQKEEERKKKKELQEEIEKVYKTLVKSWDTYLKLLEKANYTVDSVEEKAILFVEIIDDAERQKKNTARS